MSADLPDGRGERVADVRGASLAEETVENRFYSFGAFRRWCEKQDLPALPTTEDVLRVYLRNCGLMWSHSYRRSVVLAIDWVHDRAGLPRPAGAATRDYLRALVRMQGCNTRPPVHPLTADQVAAMVARELTGPDSAVLTRARFAVLRADALAGHDWVSFLRDAPALLGRPAAAYEQTSGAVQLQLDDGQLLVEESRDPLGYAALCAVLSRPAEAAGPLAVPPGQELSLRTQWIDTRARAFGARNCADAGTVRAWSDEQWYWMQRMAMRGAARGLRDIAWLLLDWTLGSRFSDLHHAELHEARPDGTFVVVMKRHKGAPDGSAPIYAEVQHLSECGDLCPACALGAQLTHLERSSPKLFASGLLFPTTYGQEVRVMTRQSGSLRLQQMWEAAGFDPAVTVSTRSVRSGAAMHCQDEYGDIQRTQRLLNQKSPTTTRHYLRARGSETVEVHLDYSQE